MSDISNPSVHFAKIQQFICPCCRVVGTWLKSERPTCPKCGCEKMAPLAGTLQVPRYFIFAIVTNDGMEERYFTLLPGQMPEMLLGAEVKLPLPEDDAICALPEWLQAGGWVFVSRRAVDFVTGSIWLECHFLDAEANAMLGTEV